MRRRVNDLEREKREIRMRIGRLRRRVDGRIRATQREGGRLLSWQTYVRRYPAAAIVAAMGAGLAFSAGLSGPLMTRWLGMRMMRQAGRHLGAGISDELSRIWAASTPVRPPTDADGDDDARS